MVIDSSVSRIVFEQQSEVSGLSTLPFVKKHEGRTGERCFRCSAERAPDFDRGNLPYNMKNQLLWISGK